MKGQVAVAIVAIGIVVAAVAGYMIVKGVLTGEKGNARDDSAMGGKTREFSIVAKQWSFEPSEIRVKVGDTVRLKIRSIDVSHGLSIPDLGVNSYIEPGKETVVEFKATKAGRFPFFCSVYCGEGHGNMRGVLVVEE